MTASAGTVSATVAVVPGDGILVRRSTAVFFSPVGPDDERLDALLEAFETAPDQASPSTGVTEAVVAAEFDAVPFAVVSWSGALEVVVFGAVEVVTDHPALPMLSGAGSGSWVERRLAAIDGSVTVTIGGPADARTELSLGRVRAGGFAARLTPGGPRSPDEQAEPPPPPPSPSPADSATSRGATADDGEDPGRRLEGLAALRAATGGDWMEESLGLGPPDPPPARESSPLPVVVDDEVTLGGDDEEPAAAFGAPPPWPGDALVVDPAVAAATDTTDPTGATGATDSDEPVDDVAAVTPSTDAGARADRRLVPSRQCPDGHPNPPLAEVCRECDAAIDAAAPTVAVPQPALGQLVLADGGTRVIEQALVLGRRPEATAARLPAGARVVVVGSAATVSRTHAVVQPDGWMITVTDCGSRSGTALLAPGGDEPQLLQPWIPHEVAIGARIFLGGPTSVSIEAVGEDPP